MKWLLTILLMTALIGLWWFLDGILGVSGWSVWSNDDWHITTVTDWKVVLYLWPVALAGAVISLTLTLPVLQVLYRSAAHLDHVAQVNDLTKRAEQAEKRAKSAEQRAKANLANEKKQVDQLRQEANEHYQESLQLREKVTIFKNDAQAQIDKINAQLIAAQKEMARAESRRNNAEYAANRHKRKLAKIQRD